MTTKPWEMHIHRTLTTVGWNVIPTPEYLTNDADVNVKDICTSIGKDGYHFVVYPVGGLERCSWEFPKNFNASSDVVPPIHLPDVQFSRFLWKTYVMGRVSSWIDTDNENEDIAKVSMNALRMEIRHAAYLAVQNVVVPLKNANFTNLVKVVQHCLYVEGLDIKVIIFMPTDKKRLANSSKINDLYNLWVDIRSSIKNYTISKVCVGLHYVPSLNAEFSTSDPNKRWLGEPVNLFGHSAELFNEPTDMIVAQGAMSAVFNAPFEQRLLMMADVECEPIIRKNFLHCSIPLFDSCVFGNNLPSFTDCDFASYDLLGLPLSTSWRELSSNDYQTMENDKKKYKLYAEAMIKVVHKQLLDLEGGIVIYILGCGRSGLVQICMDVIKASVPEHIRNRISITAVEKNAHAVLSLNHYNDILWHKKVKIIEGDIHHVLKDPKLPKADIIITELLGSFGDNGLAPECWKSALPIIKDVTEFVPQKIETFVAPVCAPKVRDQLRDSAVSIFEQKRAINTKFNKETGTFEYWRPKTWFDYLYVCHIKKFYRSAPLQHISQFKVPKAEEEVNNERHNIVKFDIEYQCEIDGFVGYFAATLTKDVFISNSPKFRKGRYTCPKSWLPSYLPLRDGIRVKGRSQLLLHFWRKVSDGGVWYEWKVEYTDALTGSQLTTELQNENGDSCFMPLPPHPEEIKEYF